MEDQEHLRRPTAYAPDGDQLGDDGLVVHVRPGIDVHPAGSKVHRQVHQILHLARAQAGGTHVVHLQAQQQFRAGLGQQQGKAVPHRLRRLDRDLLTDDGTRQGIEGIL